MKKPVLYSTVLFILIAFVSAVFAAPPFSAEINDSDNSVCAVRFETESTDDSITLTAVLTKYGENVNGVVIALDYDPSLVSITDDDIKALSGGTMFSLDTDSENGFASAECAYFDGLSENTPLVSFRFKLADGTAADSINSSHIKLCTSRDYLTSLSSNYSLCGGIFITNGSDSFTALNSDVSVSFDLPEAPAPAEETNRSAAVGSIVAIIAGIVLIIAVILYAARPKARSTNSKL